MFPSFLVSLFLLLVVGGATVKADDQVPRGDLAAGIHNQITTSKVARKLLSTTTSNPTLPCEVLSCAYGIRPSQSWGNAANLPYIQALYNGYNCYLYLPLNVVTCPPAYTIQCQTFSCLYGIMPHASWGSAPPNVQQTYTAYNCDNVLNWGVVTCPPDYKPVCQAFSCTYNMKPMNTWGSTPSYVQTQYNAIQCDTYMPWGTVTCPLPVTLGTAIMYFRWVWGTGASSPPGGANVGIVFSGYADPQLALTKSSTFSVTGQRFITVGGNGAPGDDGSYPGRWTATRLIVLTNSILAGNFYGYNGMVFDIESGDSGLASLFDTAFKAARHNNFRVVVTICHSAPNEIGDAEALMNSFFTSTYIDYLSPQLYTQGTETANQYAVTSAHPVPWSAYAKAVPMIAPVIVRANMYNDAVNYFQGQGVTLRGYIQWAQS